MCQLRSILRLCFIFTVMALQFGNAYSSKINSLSSVEMQNGKTRVQYRIEAENNTHFKSFHNLLLKAGYERENKSNLGTATLFERSPLTVETFLYNNGKLVVSITVEGEGKSFFADRIVDLQGELAYPIFELVSVFGEEVPVRTGIVAYDFEKLRCFPKQIENGIESDIQCFIIYNFPND